MYTITTQFLINTNKNCLADKAAIPYLYSFKECLHYGQNNLLQILQNKSEHYNAPNYRSFTVEKA